MNPTTLQLTRALRELVEEGRRNTRARRYAQGAKKDAPSGLPLSPEALEAIELVGRP